MYRYSRKIRKREDSKYPMPVPQKLQTLARIKRVRQQYELGNINSQELAASLETIWADRTPEEPDEPDIIDDPREGLH